MKHFRLIVTFIVFVSISQTLKAQDFDLEFDGDKLVALDCFSTCMQERYCGDLEKVENLQCANSYDLCEKTCSYSQL